MGFYKRYKENQFGMRWRVDAEVITGKGQFVCANKKCSSVKKLRTWEVNFGYVEHNIKKNALIKCRLCHDCSYKLNYHHKKKEVTKRKKKSKRRKRSRSSSSSSDSDSDDDESRRRRRKKEELLKASEEEKKKEEQEKDVWSKPQEKEEKKTREDEFDSFLDDLFL